MEQVFASVGTHPRNWQDALWAIPTSFGSWWDNVVAVMAVVAALIIFTKMILHHDLTALVVSRIFVGVGLIDIALVPFNSGWLKIGVAMMVSGMLMSSILIASGWCERNDQTLTLGRALWRWMKRTADIPLTWLCGPFRPWTPDESHRKMHE